MLASIIDQLLIANIDATTATDIVTVVKALYDRGVSTSCRSAEKLWNTFQAMLRHVRKKVLVVLDALDECKDRTDIMRRLATSDHAGARFLATSRPEQDLIDLLDSSPAFRLRSLGMDVDSDILNVVTETVSHDRRLMRFRDQIITTIKEKADGMFRYAALMLEELNRPTSRKVPALLKSMPVGLYGFYELILHQLNVEGLSFRKKILSAMVVAYRPMKVAEMAYALVAEDTYSDEDTDLNEDFNPLEYKLINAEDVRRVCGSLVEITAREELRFTHLSVKEFLLQCPDKLGNKPERVRSCLVSLEEAHISMAITCGENILRTLHVLHLITKF